MIDDRIPCTECSELARNGRCLSATRGERTDVARDYSPAQPLDPRRCEFFVPLRDAADQRPGRERWPTLWAAYRTATDERNRERRAHVKRGLERAKAALAQGPPVNAQMDFR